MKLTMEQVIDFLKDQDMETIGQIWMEFSHEMAKRWKKGKKDSLDPKELESLFKGVSEIEGVAKSLELNQLKPPIPRVSVSSVSAIPLPPPLSHFEFGFPPLREIKQLSLGIVHYQKKNTETSSIKGGISCGNLGLSIITEKKAISLKYENIEKIEWLKEKKKSESKT